MGDGTASRWAGDVSVGVNDLTIAGGPSDADSAFIGARQVDVVGQSADIAEGEGVHIAQQRQRVLVFALHLTEGVFVGIEARGALAERGNVGGGKVADEKVGIFRPAQSLARESQSEREQRGGIVGEDAGRREVGLGRARHRFVHIEGCATRTTYDDDVIPHATIDGIGQLDGFGGGIVARGNRITRRGGIEEESPLTRASREKQDRLLAGRLLTGRQKDVCRNGEVAIELADELRQLFVELEPAALRTEVEDVEAGIFRDAGAILECAAILSALVGG